MSLGLSPKLPLRMDKRVGSYALTQTHTEMIKQNFKNLILTNPGERIMDTRFGAGLRMLLFELNTDNLRSEIVSRINKQVNLYMPFVLINQIVFHDEGEGISVNPNSLELTINYSIPPLGVNDFLDISL
tara:strand:- start:1998 stop:2384 length:387 start_codon:yes stop_codon:yes gene_type:complete